MLVKKMIAASLLAPAILLTACASGYKAPKDVELGEIRIRNEINKDIVILMADEPLKCSRFTQRITNIGGIEDHYFKVPLGKPISLQFKERVNMFARETCTGIVTINPRAGEPIEITIFEDKGACKIKSAFTSPYVYVRQHLKTPVEGANCGDNMVGTPAVI